MSNENKVESYQVNFTLDSSFLFDKEQDKQIGRDHDLGQYNDMFTQVQKDKLEFIKPIDINKVTFKYFTEITNHEMLIGIDRQYITELNDQDILLYKVNQPYQKQIRVYNTGKPSSPKQYGGIVVASYYDKFYTNFNSPYGVLYVGISICNSLDKFNFKKGKFIALNRLLSTPKQPYEVLGKYMINGLQYPNWYFSSTPIEAFNKILFHHLNSDHYNLCLYVRSVLQD
jgi:hypothetical protein